MDDEGAAFFIGVIVGVIILAIFGSNFSGISSSSILKANLACESINSEVDFLYADRDLYCKNNAQFTWKNGGYGIDKK